MKSRELRAKSPEPDFLFVPCLYASPPLACNVSFTQIDGTRKCTSSSRADRPRFRRTGDKKLPTPISPEIGLFGQSLATSATSCNSFSAARA